MSARTFTLTLEDGDRLMILTALGFASMHLLTSNVNSTAAMRRPIEELIQRLSAANGKDRCDVTTSQPVADPKSGTEAARAVLSRPAAPPILPVDYFARDRKGGTPKDAPSGAELQTVKVLQAKTIRAAGKVPRLEVIYTNGKANCFDELLWPRIVANTEAKLWIAESGNYLNIVGVRA